MKIAIMIDGAFYLKRMKRIWGRMEPEQAADKLCEYCRAHIERSKMDNRNAELYRIFYYDCPPTDIQSVYPISKEPYIYLKFPASQWRIQFHQELTKKRKIALRMGNMDQRNPKWNINEEQLKRLLKREISVDDLEDSDFFIDIRQKGVDMRMGIDIASVSYKKQVSQIVLISGDSAFVPAAKLARREGVDVILDPLWQPVREDLFEHIDGLRSMIKDPKVYPEDHQIVHPHPKWKNKKKEMSMARILDSKRITSRP